MDLTDSGRPASHSLSTGRQVETAATGTAVAIVVVFENTSSFGFAGDANGLEKLNSFVKQGGEPLGLISVCREGK